MATKTLIRNKKKHQVALEEGSQLAQSAHGGEAGTPVPAPPPRKTSAGKRPPPAAVSAPEAKASPAAGKTSARMRPAPTVPVAAAAPAPARKRAHAGSASATGPRASAQAPARQAAPRLPARVPADGLWEADSAVMQRLQALVERNAQLAEQLQGLQPSRMSKGDTP